MKANYSLKINSEDEKSNLVLIPKNLIDKITFQKFGSDIQLIWRLYILKDENNFKKIQKDSGNGIYYSEINVEIINPLTQNINNKFLEYLLNNQEHFKLRKLTKNEKYNLIISIRSKNKINSTRGMSWHDVNVISFFRKHKKWKIENELFWNHKKWTVLEMKNGIIELIKQ